ncbi:TadE/TadG family type IV pilus assembly protein [Primorskyibacter sp. S87]|uniref:TadE/TadG family type IV pilus assembly protein n=1 Tax=Primorskyibacter sp. S87 TaxID=3415126 RepID=UPI003C7A6D28
MFLHRLKTRLFRFGKDTEGSIAVEALITFPMLLWSLMACYTYFDGYRQSASNLKAAYTIGDLISRETRTVDDTFIDSMHELFGLMVRNETGVSMRISLIRYDEDRDEHTVRWSTVRGGYTIELTDELVVDLRDDLPPMPDEDTLILVETRNIFVPPYKVGIDDIPLENFIFTRPRFTNEIAGSV